MIHTSSMHVMPIKQWARYFCLFIIIILSILSHIFFVYKFSFHSIRRYSPARLNFKKDSIIPANIIENISNIR